MYPAVITFNHRKLLLGISKMCFTDGDLKVEKLHRFVFIKKLFKPEISPQLLKIQRRKTAFLKAQGSKDVSVIFLNIALKIAPFFSLIIMLIRIGIGWF